MKDWQKGIYIEGQYCNQHALPDLCQHIITSSKTPEWKKRVYAFLTEWLNDKDHIVQHSSGTTGKPKKILLTKEAMMASAVNTCNFLGLTEGQTAWLCLPVEYIAGKMMIVRSLMCGLQLELSEPAGNPVLPEAHQIDFCAMVPLQVYNYLKSKTEHVVIKKLLIGGAEINPELERMIRESKIEAYSTYGMAETCSHIAIRKINGPQHRSTYDVLPGNSVSTDKRGCLVVDADFLPKKVVTNDLVKIAGTGSFQWIGRIDNLINSGGVKIIPEEIESFVAEKTGLECAVIGLADIKLGQKPVLVFEKKSVPIPASAFKSNLIAELSPQWPVKEIVYIEKLPRNNSFKINKKKLAGILS